MFVNILQPYNLEHRLALKKKTKKGKKHSHKNSQKIKLIIQCSSAAQPCHSLGSQTQHQLPVMHYFKRILLCNQQRYEMSYQSVHFLSSTLFRFSNEGSTVQCIPCVFRKLHFVLNNLSTNCHLYLQGWRERRKKIHTTSLKTVIQSTRKHPRNSSHHRREFTSPLNCAQHTSLHGHPLHKWTDGWMYK